MLSSIFKLHYVKRSFSVFYNIDHEWIEVDHRTRIGRIGITSYAHSLLGDVLDIQMPEVGDRYKQGEILGKISTKRIIDDIYCPLSGEIAEVNSKILEEASLINLDPNNEGWLVKIKIDNLEELDALYDKSGYFKLVEQLKRKQ